MQKFKCTTIVRTNTYNAPSGEAYVFVPDMFTKVAKKEDVEYFRKVDIFVEEKASEVVKKKVSAPLKPKKVRKDAEAKE